MIDRSNFKAPTSYEALFGTSTKEEESESNTFLKTELLVPNIFNPFYVKDDESMAELVESIKTNGILNPLIVQPFEDGTDKYEVLSGHRRLYAAKKIGMNEIPVIIKENLKEEEANLILVDSNLNREKIYPSEKAKAYKIKFEAIKKKVGRNWTTEDPTGRTTEIIAKQMGVSDRTIKNYLRINMLTNTLLELVDSNDITIKAAVQLSYLKPAIQDLLVEFLERENATISEEQAELLRQKAERLAVTLPDIYSILGSHQHESKQRKKTIFKVSATAKAKYFPTGFTDNEIESVISELLTEWAKDNNPEFEK